MDYQVGSLADMISASSSKKKKTIKKETGDERVKIEFQKVESTAPVSSKKKGKKKRRFDEMPVNGSGSINKMIKKTVTFDVAEDSSPAKKRKPSISTGAKKRLEMKDLPKLPKKNKQKKKPTVGLPETKLDPERERRTIFVGNLCLTTSIKSLKKLFRKFGPVEAARKRNAPVADPRTPKKVAIIKSEFHPDRTSLNAYVRFETEESAHKALKMNGEIYREHVLRVDLVTGAMKSNIYNPKKAVFIGNIKFTLEEDDLRQVFQSCGEIESIRVVRDAKTGMGKGFGYVNFANTESVELALKLNGEELEKRPIRVSRCDGNAQPNRELKETKKKKEAGVKLSKKKFEKKTDEGETPGRPVKTEFKGLEIVDQKVKKNKKKKKNKSEQQKKLMLSKLEVNPKPKKTEKSLQKKLKKLKKPKKIPSE